MIVLKCPECNSTNLTQINTRCNVKCKDCGFESYTECFILDEIENEHIVIKPEIPKRSGKDIVDIVKDKYNKLYGDD